MIKTFNKICEDIKYIDSFIVCYCMVYDEIYSNSPDQLVYLPYNNIMGVKNLIKFIKKYAPDAIAYKKISDFRNTRIGIDANLLIYKIVYGIRVRGYDIKNDDLIVTHIHSMLLKFMGMLKYKITPIFVFDSVMPSIKHNTLKKRDIAKKKMAKKYESSITDEGKRIFYYTNTDITQQEIEDCQKLILIFGFNLVHAKEEADCQLVNLLKNKVIDCIVTDDMDILLFGGNIMLKNFTVDSKKYIQQINLELILSNAMISFDQLIRIGLLHGTDYCDKNTSSSKAYKIVINDQDDVKNECMNAYNYFIKAPSHDIHVNDMRFDQKIDVQILVDFLIKHAFNNDYIEKLKKQIHEYTI